MTKWRILLVVIITGLVLFIKYHHKPAVLKKIDSKVVETTTSLNNQIHSIDCNNVEIIADGIRSNGYLYYEKTRHFRMRIYRRNSLEMDFGSNDDVFWFYAKRMKNPAIYYCKHSQRSHSNLKTPFDPIWVMESLCIGEINQKAYLDTTGRLVKKRYKVENDKIVKIGVYDENDKLIVTSEVLQWNENIPTKIKSIWYEENHTMTITLHNPQINTDIDSKYWNMPRGKNIDMTTIYDSKAN